MIGTFIYSKDHPIIPHSFTKHQGVVGGCNAKLKGRGSWTLYSYLEGQGDLVSRLIRGMTRVTIWVIVVVNLLTKSP